MMQGHKAGRKKGAFIPCDMSHPLPGVGGNQQCTIALPPDSPVHSNVAACDRLSLLSIIPDTPIMLRKDVCSVPVVL